MVAVACGTGGTLAGLAAGLGPRAARPGRPGAQGGFLGAEIRALQSAAFGGPRGDWRLDERFHFGGYARTHPGLDAFAADFEDRHGLPVERLYVAKMLYGLDALAEEGAFPRGHARSRAVITGTPDPRTDALQDRPVPDLRLPVGRRLLQVQPAQQRPQHLVVDPPLVPQPHEDLALGARSSRATSRR